MTPQEEAAELFRECSRELAGQHDLVSVMKRAQWACQLAGWKEQGEWFRKELAGYSGETVPDYRKANGRAFWRPEPLQRRMEWAVGLQFGRDEIGRDEQPVLEAMDGPLEALVGAASTGWLRVVDTKEAVMDGKVVMAERVHEFEPAMFASIISAIDRMVFDFTSQTYQVLHYGNALGNIWEEHRAAIEPKLRAVGLAQHLTAIDSGLQSDNKEHWRMAVYECRSLLTDLADALWRDPQATYEFLPGDGKGGKLDVTHDKVANRFGAYLHQKGIYSSSGALLRSEMDRLFDSLRQVLGAEGKAHAPMSREDARSVAILTYLLIGELAIRTDFQPVRTYSAPAS